MGKTRGSCEQLTICELNTENLFLSMAYYEGQNLQSMSEQEWREVALMQLQRKQKPLWQLWGLAKAIEDIDPDVLMMVEVGGQESLDNFNRHFLADRFSVFFIEGNASRGIDLGFLVKKKIHFRTEAFSNRDTPIEVTAWQGKYMAKFSRDVAELRLYDPNGLKLILLLTHLKSKISTEVDFKGKDVRTAEAFALVRIYESLRTSYPETPIIVGGDFNADLASLELEQLGRTDLTDFHELLNTPTADRVSLVHFDFSGSPNPMVLDYLLVSPQLKNRIVSSKSCTYRYKGFYDIPEALPDTLKQRRQMPSDHYPLVLTVKI